MPRVRAHLAEHNLDVRKDARPVKQALRCFATEKHYTIGEEIARLLAVVSRGRPGSEQKRHLGVQTKKPFTLRSVGDPVNLPVVPFIRQG